MESVVKECYFASLPMELHLHIRNELLKDPDGEYKYFKSLRLVCKLFDRVWSPVVLVNLLLFPNNPIRNFDPGYLGQLVDGKSDLRTFSTVTLKNWHFLITRVHYFFDRMTDIWVEDWKQALILIPLVFIIVIPVQLFRARSNLYHLSKFSTILRARRYARAFPRKLQLPNVSCARLIIQQGCGIRWELYWTTKFLMIIPNLTELVLRLPWDVDMAYIAKRLNPLRTLRKFTLQIYSYHTALPPHSRSKFSFFSSVIARNPNLTHIGLMLSRLIRCDFSAMLRDIPDNKPLKLECITIDCLFENADALLPHIQSLSSLETRLNDATLYNTLGRALVFPPTISVDSLDNRICMYLEHHPGVSNFSIDSKGYHGSSRQDFGLSKVIMRHSGSLQRLRTRSHMLLALDAEVALLKCVQLNELVLIFTNGSIINDIHILGIAARLSRSLTVVIEHSATFWGCVRHCRNSENPLLHDLAGRIVYEKPDKIPLLNI